MQTVVEVSIDGRASSFVQSIWDGLSEVSEKVNADGDVTQRCRLRSVVSKIRQTFS